MRVQPHGGVAGLECTIVDATGGIALVFLGRRSIGGMKIGTRVVAEGTVVGDDRASCQPASDRVQGGFEGGRRDYLFGVTASGGYGYE